MELHLLDLSLLLILVAIALRFGQTRSTSHSGAIIASGLLFLWAIVASSASLGSVGALYHPYWSLLACITALTGFFVAPPVARSVERRGRINTPGTLFLAALLLLLSLSVLWITAVSEPTNIDDLYYHYPKLLHLLRRKSFIPSGLEVVDGYPQNGELIALFLIAMSNMTFIADAVQILALPLYLASVLLLAGTYGVNRPTRVFLALLSCFVPAFWSLLITFHTDIFASTFLVTAVALISSRGHFDRRTKFFLLGATLGLLIGTKFVALPWGLILIPWLLANRDRPKTLSEWALLGVPLIAAGSTTYVINLVRYNNPLYPYTISLLGFTLYGKHHSLGGLWEEQMTKGVPSLMRIINSWFSPSAMAQSNHEHWYGGLGTLWPYLFFMTALTVLSPPLRERRFMGLLLIGLLLLCVTPANFTARFTLFLVPFSALALGKVLTHLQSKGRLHLVYALRSFALLFAFHSSVQFFVLVSTELKLGIRAPDSLESCRRAARPADLKTLSAAHSDVFQDADVIDVELSEVGEERLWSFACLWALSPKGELRFRKSEERGDDLTHRISESKVVIRSASLLSQVDTKEDLLPVYTGSRLTLLRPPR